jgi:transcriptional regulator with XRE-family HTH domain
MRITETGMAAAKRSTESQPPPISIGRRALALNLRAARLEVGLSQQELADLSGVSRKYVGEIESAPYGANVSIDVLAVIAQHVRRSPVDLLDPTPRKRPRRT